MVPPSLYRSSHMISTLIVLWELCGQSELLKCLFGAGIKVSMHRIAKCGQQKICFLIDKYHFTSCLKSAIISLQPGCLYHLILMCVTSGCRAQSAAKLFEHLRNYLQFFSDLIGNFHHLLLVINNKKLKDCVLINFYFIKLRYIRVFWHELS